MSTLDEIAQERQHIAERLARLDADRAKLAEQLGELEIAERVLSRFGRSDAAPSRRRVRAVAQPAAPSAPAPEARGRGRKLAAQGLSLSDATLRAVQRHPEGVTAADVMAFLTREFGMSVRPNHLAIALQRHRRAGRLDIRDRRWFPPQATSASEAQTPA
jgi:hypothetical protein